MIEHHGQQLRTLGDQLGSGGGGGGLLTERQRSFYFELVEAGEPELALEMLANWLSAAAAPLPAHAHDEIHRLARALGNETRIDSALRSCPRIA